MSCDERKLPISFVLGDFERKFLGETALSFGGVCFSFRRKRNSRYSPESKGQSHSVLPPRASSLPESCSPQLLK